MTTLNRMLWLFRAMPRPLPDVALERMLADVPGSTVRGTRKRLERLGLIQKAGIRGSGRRKYWVWTLAEQK